MTNYAYKRVSTTDQTTARQLADCDVPFAHVFEEKVSGKNVSDRQQLQLLLDIAGQGDTVYVHSLDRLARNLEDLLKTVNTFVSNGASVVFVKEGLTFGNGEGEAMSKLLLSVFGAVAEFERSLIRERQAEGIAQARAEGKLKGRPAINPAVFADIDREVNLGIPATKACRNHGVSRTAYYNYKNAKTE